MAMSTTGKPRGRRDGSGKGIQSIEIGIRLLDALIEAREPQRLKDLAERAGLTASKARMYLVSLIRGGLIEQDQLTALYGPGPKALRLGMIALGQYELFTAARELVHALGRETGHPVLLSAWDGQTPVIMASSESPDALPIAFRIGARTPLWTTATGAVFLAFLPEPVSTRLIAEECPEEARDRIGEDIARIKTEGYRYFELVRLNQQVALSGYGAIAAPVFDDDGKFEFVVTMLVATSGRRGKPTKLIALLRERCTSLSHGSPGRRLAPASA